VTLRDAGLTVAHQSKGLFSSASQIQPGVFGVTAYEGGSLFADGNGSQWAAEWGVDSVGFPLNVEDYNLPEPPLANGSKAGCPGPTQITEAELRAWWDPTNPTGAARPFHGVWPNNIYPWGNWIPNMAGGGAEPFAYLLGNTWGNGECATNLGGPPRNATLWGVAHGLSLVLAQHTCPELRFAHIGNEPNAGWYKRVPHDTGQAFASFFSEAAAAIKTVVKGEGGGSVYLGGAVMCWGPLDGGPGLSQWSWISELIDASLHVGRAPPTPAGTNVLDFVDFHAYGNGEANANRIEAEVHMVAAYAASRHHVHMPSAVTETSWRLGSWAEWANHSHHFNKRTLPRLRQMMAALAHPDKIFSVQEHDMGADAGGKFRFAGCGAASSSGGGGGGGGGSGCECGDTMPNGTRVCATPEMEMFRALRPLRGVRLDRSVDGVNDATDDLKFEATLNPAISTFGAVVLAAANFGGASVAITLRLDPGWTTTVDNMLAPWSAVVLDGVSFRMVAAPRPTHGGGPSHDSVAIELVLPAESLLTLTMPLTRPHTLGSMHRYTEVFADDVGVAIDNASSSAPGSTAGSSMGRRATFATTVTLPGAGLTGADPRLRFGVKGAALSCDSWTVSLSAVNSDTSSSGGGCGGAAPFVMVWPASAEFRGGGCRSSPSSQINCTAVLNAGNGVGFAELSLRGWSLPPTPPFAAAKLTPDRFLGGQAIRIDPWEMARYTAVNTTRCAELCAQQSDWSDLGPSCVGFRLRSGGGGGSEGEGGAPSPAVCTMLASREPSKDRPARPGEVVTSGVALLRSVEVRMQASCETEASPSQPLSYLAFLSLVVD
jgi:hypothetical protein